jgi:hypothetical protein
MVQRSNGDFTVTWFLDGRRKQPPDGWLIPAGTGVSTHPFFTKGDK